MHLDFSESFPVGAMHHHVDLAISGALSRDQFNSCFPLFSKSFAPLPNAAEKNRNNCCCCCCFNTILDL
jgi:hypothetical protein